MIFRYSLFSRISLISAFYLVTNNLSQPIMVRPYEMLDMLDVPPPLRMQPTPSRVKCYMYWGFTIYRTHYSPQSDKQWEVLLDCLNRQMTLALGYFRDQEWEDEVLWQKADYCSIAREVLRPDWCTSSE